MRIVILMNVVLLTGGCHLLPCGGCAEWETCAPAATPTETECVLNPGATFDLVAQSGHVSGSGRDLFDGIPNPKVCVTAGGLETCSSVIALSYSPSWQMTLFTSLDGEALLSAPLAVRFVDTGLFKDLDVCHGDAGIIEDFLHSGGFRFNCSTGSYVRFGLKNVDDGTPLSLDGGRD